uniref:Uncharacterized protein n=1 Tax=Anguilla anguilla TaxID=7936 RepID=A0A0E9QEY6_ANGAN
MDTRSWVAIPNQPKVLKVCFCLSGCLRPGASDCTRDREA